MDIGSILLTLALLLVVGLFISRPLVERRETSKTSVDIQKEHERSTLLAERDRLLNALEELDFDYSLEKIPEADYPVQRNALLQKGAEVLRQIDDYDILDQEDEEELRIETAIASRREGAARAPAAAPSTGRKASRFEIEDDEIEARIAARRREREDKSAGFCPQCGNSVSKSDSFCPKCGNALT
jgi:hypothetical protein